MSRLLYVLALYLCVCWPQYIIAEELMTDVDANLTSALGASALNETKAALRKAETILKSIMASHPNVDARTDLSTELRQTFIESLEQAAALEESGQRLNAVRKLAKALDLIRSLWEASKSNKTESPASLDHLVSATYAKLKKMGLCKDLVKPTYVCTPGEELIFRTFIAGDAHSISVFELCGEPGTRRAIWSEKRLDNAPDAIVHRIEEFLDNRERPYPRESFPYLFIMNATNSITYDAEHDLSKIIKELMRYGVVTFVMPPQNSSRPYTLVPTFDGGKERHEEPILIDRRSKAIVWRGGRFQSNSDFIPAAKAAAEFAREFSDNFNFKLKSSSTEAHFTGLLLPPPKVIDHDKKHFLSVKKDLSAEVVGSSEKESLTPEMVLILKAEVSAEWGQYSIKGDKNLIWLRSKELVPHENDKPERPHTDGGSK
jgi:hypothetical protein